MYDSLFFSPSDLTDNLVLVTDVAVFTRIEHYFKLFLYGIYSIILVRHPQAWVFLALVLML